MSKSKRKKKSSSPLSERTKTFLKTHKIAIFVILSFIFGTVPTINGIIIITTPLDSYTRNASNTFTMSTDNYNFTADIICNLTSRAGFFCLEPINVSAIVVHELEPSMNLTRLIFLESRDYPVSFFEIDNNSDVWVPDGGSINLVYIRSFDRNGVVNYVYEGEGTIFYDYEGEFTAILAFKEEQQVRYTHQPHEFIRPTLVIRPQAEFDQIKDSKVNLGLTWIVIGLTIWTIILTMLSLDRFKQKNQNN